MIKKVNKKDKILITGATGFLGQHVIEELLKRGYKNLKIIGSEIDLRKAKNCRKVLKGVKAVIHLAAKIGGIGENKKYPGAFLYDNLIMGLNLIEEARKAKVKKLVCVGTVCSYPDNIQIPFKENDLWKGYPSEDTAPYGIAKKTLLVQLQAYRKQYRFNGVFAILTNMFGPDDRSSHVIPDMINKIRKAKKLGGNVSLWGNGKQTREFLHVKDGARAIVDMLEKYDGPLPLNIGSGKELSIRKVAMTIAKLLNYKGKIIWDRSKPMGHSRRLIDISQAKKLLGWQPQYSFEEGLRSYL